MQDRWMSAKGEFQLLRRGSIIDGLAKTRRQDSQKADGKIFHFTLLCSVGHPGRNVLNFSYYLTCPKEYFRSLCSRNLQARLSGSQRTPSCRTFNVSGMPAMMFSVTLHPPSRRDLSWELSALLFSRSPTDILPGAFSFSAHCSAPSAISFSLSLPAIMPRC